MFRVARKQEVKGTMPRWTRRAGWGYFLFPDAEPSGYFSLLPKCLPFFALAQHPSPSFANHKHKSSYLLALTHLVFDLPRLHIPLPQLRPLLL